MAGDWKNLANFQLGIAERWLKRGNETKDIFAQFFFYFAGFNAIYFLWKIIDNLDEHSQKKHIENLLKKFDEKKANTILDRARESVRYFCKRPPIQQMQSRTVNNFDVGDTSDGKKWKEQLQDKKQPPKKRITAMGHILYLVRCNLVHGSKAESGDDKEIIEMSIEPLRGLLTEAISWTQKASSKV